MTTDHLPALLACSHGTSSPAGSRAVATLVGAVASRRPELDVRGAFVDVQSPDVPASLAALDPARDVTIVPLLLSAGYHVHVDLAESAARAAPRSVAVAGALGPDVRLARILAARLEIAGLRPADRVVLAAAGSSDASAVADCERMGELLAEVLDRPVLVGFVSAARPRLADAVRAARAVSGPAPGVLLGLRSEGHLSPGGRVAVSTFLLAPGYFADLATRLATDAGADLVSDPLLVDPLTGDGSGDGSGDRDGSGEAPPAALVEIVSDRYDTALKRSPRSLPRTASR